MVARQERPSPLRICREIPWWRSTARPQSSRSKSEKRRLAMALDLKWTRRTFMGSLGAIAGTMLSSKKLFGKAALAGGKAADKISGFVDTSTVYQELHVPPVINLQSPLTYLA